MEGGEGEEQSEELSVGEYFYQIYWIKLSQDNDHYCVVFSRVFLQRQLWIVKYYVKSSSNNLSNEIIKTTGVSREMIFQK